MLLLLARGCLDRPLVVAAFEFSFMGGSMGSVVGERFARAVRQSIEDQVPLVCFSASGGARMQEALLSLMQMSKNHHGADSALQEEIALHLSINRSYHGRCFGPVLRCWVMSSSLSLEH